jgi:hypothetical protein
VSLALIELLQKGLHAGKQEGCYYPELFCQEVVTSRKYITSLWRNGREWHSCLNILIHPMSYAMLYSLLIKTKLIPFIMKIVLDAAFSNTA